MSQRTLIEETFSLIYPHGEITTRQILDALAQHFEVEEAGDRIFISHSTDETNESDIPDEEQRI